MNDLRKTLQGSFKDKDYRHGYVGDFLNVYIATQIKVLREQRGWTQSELAERAEMAQPRISAMENINYSRWSVKTLNEIAEAFDLTLCVSFESFGKRIGDIESFSKKTLEKQSFNDDIELQSTKIKKYDQRYNIASTVSNVFHIKDYIAKTPDISACQMNAMGIAGSGTFAVK